MTQPAILIIDDNVSLAENIAEILTDEGLDAEFVGSGTEGLERLAARTFNLAIVDMRMPDMNGVEVTRAIKRTWPSLPVVIMTAYARDELLEKAQHEGALDVLAKPVDFSYLMGFVRRIAEAQTPLLIVEDDDALRANLAELLQEVEGVVPHPAASGAVARELARAVEFRAAVIDIRLPDEDGLALGTDLQRLAEGREFPIVYITGYHDDFRHRITDVLGTPGVQLLEKPFSGAALIELIRRAV